MAKGRTLQPASWTRANSPSWAGAPGTTWSDVTNPDNERNQKNTDALVTYQNCDWFVLWQN
jgi:hypothetical protein